MAFDMTRTDKQRKRLIGLLEELFQLDQPDLDFGFCKIMHAKAQTVSNFVQKDLLEIIKSAFGEADEAKIEEARLKYEQVVEQAKSFGAPDPEATEPVQKAKAAYDAAKDSGANEGEIYEHLYRFFERYYDNGDFTSRRYLARETGDPAPEGIHRDGVEYIIMGCVGKQNISGAESTLYKSEDPNSALYSYTLRPGEALLVDDRELMYGVSPVVAEGDTTYRDMILMGFHYWRRDHYRADWKDNLHAHVKPEHTL